MGHPARRRPSPAHANAARALAPVPSPTSYVFVDSDGSVDDPLDPRFLEELAQLRVVAATADAPCVEGSLANTRGYRTDDLFAVAEVAYVYLFGGHERLALVLFEGLAAVHPCEPYFELARGLAHDLLGDLDAAARAYARAAKLAPHDPRPDVNRAEIHLERRELREANALLQRARGKAVEGDELFQKIAALLQRVQHLHARGGRARTA